MTVLFASTTYNPEGGRFGLGSVDGYPVSGDVSSLWGAKDTPEHSEGHTGIDIAVPSGTPILAPASMLITDVFSLDIPSTNPLWIEIKRIFGNSVWATIGLADGRGFRTLFSHLEGPPVVRERETVEAGTLLGHVGSTGLSTGPHLHWGLAPQSSRWLARGETIDVLDYCGDDTEDVVLPPAAWIGTAQQAAILTALADARAAIERAANLVAGKE
jgi:murein DD-endopeptidase MepM/ murein hydrolase activator NlpD